VHPVTSPTDMAVSVTLGRVTGCTLWPLLRTWPCQSH